MGRLEDKLIELSFSPDSDLFIEWSNLIKESVLTETARGRIGVKYSEVPYLVYFLARKIGTDFLSRDIIEEAKREKFISFANKNIEDFSNQANYLLNSKKKRWELLEKDETKDKIFDEELRLLKSRLPASAEYIGYVPPSAEYPGVNILYKEDIYLAQRENILKLDNELSKELLKRTIEHYGLVVSPCLNALEEYADEC